MARSAIRWAGHNSVYTAVFDDRIKVVVSSCGLDSYLDYFHGDEKVWMPQKGWTQTRYMPRLADYRGRLEEIPFDFHELIGALAPRHVLIVAPLKDSNFRWDSVDRIAAAAKPIYRLYGQPARLQIEHPDCEHDFPQDKREQAYALLDEVLKPSPRLGEGGIPKKSSAALAGIRVPEGFVVELAAGPPLIDHPMMAGFDDRGRLFVAETAGLNLKADELLKTLPNRVRLLEDTDGDGRFDKSTIFADKMTMPQGRSGIAGPCTPARRPACGGSKTPTATAWPT